jgi:hydroxyethylthiazole kinase-like uncharacterized protein yjeF
MKILNADQIRQWDEYTITNGPISSINLMERASKAFKMEFTRRYPANRKVVVVCGPGNNGGDGLAIARLLQLKGRDVSCILMAKTDKVSPDERVNLIMWHDLGNDVEGWKYIKHIDKDTIIIDALFGSGLNRELKDNNKKIVEYINSLDNEVVSVDIPSGMFASGEKSDTKIQADLTLTFQCPRLAFLLPDTGNAVGELKLLDIGLLNQYHEEVQCPYELVEESNLRSLIKRRPKFSHKGDYGHCLLACGGKGMMGAAVLSAKASLRCGVGKVTVSAPESGFKILTETLPEAMTFNAGKGDFMDHLPESNGYSAIGIGCGIGTDKVTKSALKDFLKTCESPLVLDADALNILSEDKSAMAALPKGTIITPHVKEFHSLFEECENALERLNLGLKMARKNQIYILIKGAYSCLCCPDGKAYFNSTGNPGMATAGSGDVLTGIITSLLAQGFSSKDSAVLGMYLHGKSGDMAAEKYGESGLKAGDIVDFIGKAIESLEN